MFLYPRRGMQALFPCGCWGQNKEKTVSQSNSQCWEQSCRALAAHGWKMKRDTACSMPAPQNPAGSINPTTPQPPIHPSLALALIPAAQCCLQHRAPERGRRVMDVAVWAQNGCGLGVTVICCCLITTNQIFKQTLNAPWPYCYLAGAGDLDKSLKLCARGFYFVPASFVSIPSQACVTQQWS